MAPVPASVLRWLVPLEGHPVHARLYPAPSPGDDPAALYRVGDHVFYHPTAAGRFLRHHAGRDRPAGQRARRTDIPNPARTLWAGSAALYSVSALDSRVARGGLRLVIGVEQPGLAVGARPAGLYGVARHVFAADHPDLCHPCGD